MRHANLSRTLMVAVAIVCGAGGLHGQTVAASGFNNPRGITFGPDGFLYVADGGFGHTNSTVDQCSRAPASIGPYLGAPNGALISKVSPTGKVSIVVSGFPSIQPNAASGNLASGVADIALFGPLTRITVSTSVEDVLWRRIPGTCA